jgi:hypothetical protein
MFKTILRDRHLVILFVVALLIKLFSMNEAWVEKYYTYGFYPYIAKMQRGLFGWIPFSVGDILYIVAFLFFVVKVWKLLKLLSKRQVKEYLSWILFRKYLKLVFWIYIIFNISWGLNYNRLGIAHQLSLNVQPYTTGELMELTGALQQKMNFYAARTNEAEREKLGYTANVAAEGLLSFNEAAKEYPFLSYSTPSMKPSLYSHLGHLFGFTGYYNPFTGEGQLQTTVPVFMKPYIINHEIAHQVGFAKENEANFISFLTGRVSANDEVRYSIYFDMYLYAARDLGSRDSVALQQLKQQWHPQVKKDYEYLIAFLAKNSNVVEPYMTGIYDQFLKFNRQPKGRRTYSEVVAWLVAYMKKYGKESI